MPSNLGKTLTIILSICFFYFPIKAENFRFHHLSRGLSQNTGIQVYQDKHGFLWFGTRNGLNHYDGVNIKVYESNSQDTATLSNNYIACVFEDSKGNLWIGTQVGLNLYNRDKDNFTRFLPNKENEKSIVHNRINNIVEDSDGNIWCAGQSLYLFNMNSGIFDKYSTDQFTNHDPEFNKVLLDSKNNLWFVSHKQLYIFNTSDKNFKLVFDGIKHPLGKNENWFFRNIAEANDGKFWAVTDKAGLYSFEYDNKKESIKFNKHGKELGMEAYTLSSIFMESEDRYWVATENFGLFLFNPINEKFMLLKNDPDDIKSLSSNSIWCIYKDRAEKIWFGTFNTGFDFIDPYGEKFTLFQYEKKKGSLSHNNVSIFLGEPNGNLWVGTDGGGLNYLNRTTQQFKHYQHNPNQPGSLLSDAVLALSFDENGRLWVGGWDVGVNILNPDKNTFKRLTVDNSGLPSNRVFALGNDKKGNMYVGTWRNGLAVYNVHSGDWDCYKTNESETSLSGDFISTIYRDRSDNVWIGTVGYGLNVARSGNDGKLLFTRYEHNSADSASLSNNHINCIYEDEQNNFWIGTKNGLNLLDRETGKFTVYSKKDGLKSNYINSVLDDGKGNLWLGTLKGLIQFNPQTGDVRNYDSRDGIQGEQFNAHAMYKSDDGRFYFGGANGFNAFYPERIKENPIIPPVVFTDFKLFNKSVPLGKKSVLADHVSMSEKITLAYNQTVFSFDFVALNFTHPDKNQYAYKLEGFEEEWNYVGNKREATYTNLDPGEYLFKVKASNNDGIWNGEGASIIILITPPFWATWWFRGLIILFISIVVLSIFKIRTYNMRLAYKRLEISVKERTHDLLQANNDLEDKKNLLQTVIDLVPDSIFVKDEEKKYILNNKSHLSILGFTKQSTTINKSDADLFPDNDIQKYIKDDQYVIRNGRSIINKEHDIYDFITKKKIWILTSKVPFINNQGEIKGLVGISRNITYRKEFEQELKQAKYEAEAANRSKSEFLANMSHEIRTPMNGVIGMTELASDMAINKQQKEYLMFAKQSADSLLDILNDILDFSKIEAGKLELEINDFSLRKIVENAVTSMVIQAHIKGLELMSEVKTNIPVAVKGDSGRLRQIIINLIGNAVKFTDSGEIVVRAELDNTGEQNGSDLIGLHFSVSDTGTGIPKNKLTKIFESFSQANSSTTRKYGGTGLGLSISQALTELMGGKIWVESEVGKGSTFHFTARFKPGQLKEEDIIQHDKINFKGSRVLIVDDNNTNCIIIKDIMEIWGFNTTIARNGEKALNELYKATVEEKLFDIILLDYQMPEMDGFELAKRIRVNAKWKNIRIVVMSSISEKGDIRKSKRIGIDYYLNKPVRQRELYTTIMTTLGKTQDKKTKKEKNKTAVKAMPTLKILLAEDNIINQKVATNLLKRGGHEVTVANDGVEALELFNKHDFDLIFMDIQMPNMDGIEATEKIRSIGNSKSSTPIVAMTAHAMKGDRERFLDAGMDDYISKPVEVDEFLRVLKKYSAKIIL